MFSFYYLFHFCHIINYISSVFVINSLLFINKFRRGQGRLCSSMGGACAMAQWHNGQSKPAQEVVDNYFYFYWRGMSD